MKKTFRLRSALYQLLLLILVCSTGYAQQAITTAGGTATGGGGSVTYAIGQVAYSTQTGAGGTVQQGVLASTLVAAPTISSFTPTSGLVGASVTITGTNFSTTPTNNIVKFNGTVATITGTPTATSIVTSVPTGATTGKITVEVGGQTATSASDFTVTAPVPTISSFTPTSGLVGASVTITGTNFSTTPANNTVKFNGTDAVVTASTATSITTTVPVGATTGTISVTVNGVTGTSSSSFIVLPATAPFITTWQTSTASESITVPTTGTGYNYTVNWGDGTVETGITGNATHIYATAGSHTVSIYGDFPRIYFNNSGDKEKIISIDQWGDISWTSMEQAFAVCSNLYYNATDDPDLSGVTSLKAMLHGIAGINTSVAGWNVSGITNMEGLFRDIASFNQDISGWDVSKVVSFSFMFSNAVSFNQPLNSWNLSSAQNLSYMFRLARAFNQPLNNWNVSSVTNIIGMFGDGTIFNQNISGWDVSKVTVFDDMFQGNSGFDQNLGGWDISSATRMPTMFDNSAMSTSNYDSTLKGWATLSAGETKIPTGITLGSIGLKYCDSEASRNTLINSYGWTIAGDALNCSGYPSITSFNPTSGVVGTSLIISGANFSATPSSNIVKFNGTASVISASTTTSITTTVPAGATSGAISVSVGGKTRTSTSNFTVLPTPTITNFDPTSGVVGTTVTITGTNFSTTTANNLVKFNGTLAAITGTPTATSIVTSVPTGATTGKITVEVGGQTATSATDFTVTTDTSPPVVTDKTSNTITQGANVSIVVSLADPESGIASAKVLYVSTASGGSLTTANLVAPTSGSDYTSTVPAAGVGELGLAYKFEITNGAGLTNTPALSVVRVNSPAAGVAIPYSSFGKGEANHRIIAVPLNLTANTVGGVFDELMPYDDTKWRMFHYENGSNKELNGSSSIDPGKGYWLIIKDNTSINSGAGLSVQTSSETPFSIPLVQGWNQIGNPYNFKMSWADIQAANPGLPGLRKWINTMIDGAQLDVAEGGFVNVSSAGTLVFPVKKNESINGRTEDEKVPFLNPLDAPDWQVYLNVQNGELENRIAGVGMNESASNGYDVFDGLNMPRFFGSYLEVNHTNRANGYTYSKEIVPTTENNVWEFSIASSSANRIMKFSWDNSYFGDNDRELYLWDMTAQLGMNMRTTSEYSFDKNISNKFQIIFGSAQLIKEKTTVRELVLHQVWPNPAEGEMNLSFSLPESAEEQNVSIELVDLLGHLVWTNEKRYSSGYHEVIWKRAQTEASGIYLITVKTDAGYKQARVVLK